MTGTEAARLYAIVGANITGLEKGMAEAEGIVSGSSRRMDSKLKTFTSGAGSLFKHLSLGVGIVGAASVDLGMKFQQQMALIQSSAGGSANDVKVLSKQVLDMAKGVPQGPGELAQALFHLKSLGLDNVTAMSALTQATRGAIAGNANLEDVTNALGGAMRTYKINAKDAGQTMAELNGITGAGNMRMNDLTAALGTGVLPVAKLAGLSIKDVGAALATMTDENVPATSAMTRFKTSLMMMISPSKAAAGAMQLLGINNLKIGALMRGPGGLAAAIQYIQNAYLDTVKKVGKTQAMADMSKSFGGSKGASTVMMLANNIGVLDQKYGQITKSASHFNQDVAAQQKTAINQLKTAWSSIEVALIQLSGIILPPLVKLGTVIGDIANAFAGLSPTAQKVIAILVGSVVGILGAAVGIGKLVLAVRALTASDGALMVSIDAVGTALDFLAANPVVAIIIGIAALAAALVIAYKTSGTFRDFVNGALHDVMNVASAIGGFFTGDFVNFFTSAWGTITTTVTGFTDFFTQTVPNAFHTVLNWLTNNWPVIATIISGPFAPLVALATNAFGVRDKLEEAFKAVKTTVGNVVGDIVGGITGIGASILGGWDKAWGATHSAITTSFNKLSSGASTVVGNIVGFFKSLPGEVGKAIAAGAKTLWTDFTKLFSLLPGWARDVLGIHSPSTVFAEIGTHLVSGLIKGMEGKAGDLKHAAEHILGHAVDWVTGKVEGVGSAIWSGIQSVGGAIGGAFGGGGGALSANQALGQKMAAAMGWTGSNWSALLNLWNKESGWNNTARNPSSGAYGIPQALPATKLPFAGQAAGGSDPRAQIQWGLNYIAGRYGSPVAAWGHEGVFNWYAKGGIFSHPSVIGVGEAGPEAVLPISKLSGILAAAMAQVGGVNPLAGGGPLVNIEHYEVHDNADAEYAAHALGRVLTARLAEV